MMNTEAKVGAFTLLGLALLVGIVIFLSGIQIGGKPEYQFQIMYRQVTGLKIGANVSMAGISAGKVTDIKAEDNKVLVTVKVDSDIKIAKNSIFTIDSDGLMGEKFISIIPPEKSTGPVTANEIVVGTDEKGMNYLLNEAGGTLVQMQELMNNMNKVIGDKKVQQAMIDTAMNLQELTANMNQLVNVMARVANANEGNVNSIIEDMTVAMNNVKQSTYKIEGMLNNIAPVISDPQTATDLRKAINLAGSLSDKAEGAMQRLNQIKTRGSASVYYGSGGKRLRVDGDAYVYFDNKHFVKAGVNDIGGDDSSTDLQMGIINDKLTARGGLVQSKLGMGMDYQPDDVSTLTAEVYNPNHPRVNIGGAYKLDDDFYLVGKVQDINKSDDRTTYMGIQKDF